MGPIFPTKNDPRLAIIEALLGGDQEATPQDSSGRRLLPANMRIFAQGMLGRTEPITADDFSPAELEQIYRMAERNDRMSKELERPYAVTYSAYDDYGNLDDGADSVLGPLIGRFLRKYSGDDGGESGYQQYAGSSPSASVKGTLGNFRAEPTEDGYRIQDTYDFHEDWDNGGGSVARQLFDLARGEGGNLMSILETAAARSRNLSAGGGGIPVDFTIPYDEERKAFVDKFKSLPYTPYD